VNGPSSRADAPTKDVTAVRPSGSDPNDTSTRHHAPGPSAVRTGARIVTPRCPRRGPAMRKPWRRRTSSAHARPSAGDRLLAKRNVRGPDTAHAAIPRGGGEHSKRHSTARFHYAAHEVSPPAAACRRPTVASTTAALHGARSRISAVPCRTGRACPSAFLRCRGRGDRHCCSPPRPR